MDIYVVVIILIVVITCITLYTMHVNEINHQVELDKINKLEKKYATEKKIQDELRKRTKSCPIEGLNTPRTCYFKSKYNCTWNDAIKRCDAL